MNILAFIDATPRSEWVLAIAAELSRVLARRVVLLATRAELERDPGILDRAAARISVRPGLLVEKRVRPGRPRQAIVDEAREQAYEITIFPPADRRGLERLLRGSRVRSVIRRIPSTVLVARRPPSRIRRILAAVKSSPFGETTVDAAAEIARPLGAAVAAVHVVPRRMAGGKAPSGGGAEDRPPGPPAIEAVRQELAAAGHRPEVIIREGPVVECVVTEALAGRHDLLVVGHHLGEDEGLRQDLAEAIILASPIPVIAVQRRQVAAPS